MLRSSSALPTHTPRRGVGFASFARSCALVALLPALVACGGDDGSSEGKTSGETGGGTVQCDAKDNATVKVVDGTCSYTCNEGFTNNGTAAAPSCECPAVDHASVQIVDGKCSYTCDDGLSNSGTAAAPSCDCPAQDNASGQLVDGACSYECDSGYVNRATAAAPSCQELVPLDPSTACTLYYKDHNEILISAKQTGVDAQAHAQLAPKVGDGPSILNNTIPSDQVGAGYDLAGFGLQTGQTPFEMNMDATSARGQLDVATSTPAYDFYVFRADNAYRLQGDLPSAADGCGKPATFREACKSSDFSPTIFYEYVADDLSFFLVTNAAVGWVSDVSTTIAFSGEGEGHIRINNTMTDDTRLFDRAINRSNVVHEAAYGNGRPGEVDIQVVITRGTAPNQTVTRYWISDHTVHPIIDCP